MQYRTRPTVVEAIQIDLSTLDALIAFLDPTERGFTWGLSERTGALSLTAKDGTHQRAGVGDWVVKHADGTLRVCREEAFRAAYEPAEPEPMTPMRARLILQDILRDLAGRPGGLSMETTRALELALRALLKTNVEEMGIALKLPGLIAQLAKDLEAVVESCETLPDGSGAATFSMPLPKDHWLTQPGDNEPPAPLRIGVLSPLHAPLEKALWAAGRYAVRASTMNGTEEDYDPDAMVRNFVIGVLGYYTHDGCSHV